MMQRITIRFDFQAAGAEDDITVELKPAESIVGVEPYDPELGGRLVAIAGPREDIAPEGSRA